MPDQLFESLTADVTVRPLPAAEVRRRGDRRRRREGVAAVVGGVAAIAAVVVPLTVAHGGANRSVPPIATSPTTLATPPDGNVVTIVPADFPLTAGMPHERTLETLPLTTDAQKACGMVAWSWNRPVPSVDGATVGYHDTSEGGQTRSIVLYADSEQARSAQSAIEATLASCGSVDDGSGKVTQLSRAIAPDPTDVWVVRWTDKKGRPTGEGMLSRVTQVGNALLLDSATFMSAGDDAVVQQEAARLADRSATVIAAMCVFADDCASSR